MVDPDDLLFLHRSRGEEEVRAGLPEPSRCHPSSPQLKQVPFLFFFLFFLRIISNFVQSGGELGGVDLDKLLEDVEKYTLASHLLWGLWGIISVSYPLCLVR